MSLFGDKTPATPCGKVKIPNLMAERCFDALALIGGDWRTRLQSNLSVLHEGGEIRLDGLPSLKFPALSNSR